MRLWLLRHGQAEAQAARDSERALTAAGRAQVLQALTWLRACPPARALVSPYRRAQQTLELLQAQLQLPLPAQTVDWLTPLSDPRQVLRELDAQGEGDLLLVAHQPLLGELASLLCHGHRQQSLNLQTASLAELEGDFLLAGGFSLRALHHPEG